LDYAKELTADCFRNPRNGVAFRAIQKRSSKETTRADAVLGGTHVRRWSWELIAAAPNRPAWVEPPPPQPEPLPQQPAQSLRARQTAGDERAPPPVTGKRAAGSRKKLRAQLKAVYFNGGKEVRARYKRFDDFIAYLQSALGGRDPLDAGADVSVALKLTYSTMTAIERKWDVWWRQTYPAQAKDKRHRRFTIIRPIDKTPAELGAARRKDRNAELAKALKAGRLRAREQSMGTAQTTSTANATMTHAGLMAAQKANTRAQCDAILEVLAGGGEWKANALPKALGDHPAWGSVSDAKVYRTVLDRLDMLRAEGRVADRPDPGPRGSKIRVVWRR
jgi:hypothetical protein